VLAFVSRNLAAMPIVAIVQVAVGAACPAGGYKLFPVGLRAGTSAATICKSGNEV